jgi:predicted O-methyltransferase YrrM
MVARPHVRAVAVAALAMAARVPIGRRRLLAAAPSIVGAPASALWQLWTSDDMEFFVDKYATPGDAASVLGAMDRCAETSWMMNMGPAKGDLIEAAVRRKRPRRVLEIGTFLGYMSIRLARSMPRDATLTTIEVDRQTYDASLRIRAKALDAATLRRVDAVFGNASDVLPRLGAPFDAVLMDHWKPDYARDLEALRARGLLADGALVVADNVLFPGAPELLDYLAVPYVRGSDDVSGQACLVAASEVDAAYVKKVRGQLRASRARLKRGDDVADDVADLEAKVDAAARAAGARPARDASFRSPSFDTTLVRSPFEYRPDTPDGMTFSTFVRGR